jgi:serine/threonine protein phosphatase 1
MGRILAISDIHGCYDQFNRLLDKVEYDNTKDQLVLLGDYVDRGQKSKEVINFVSELIGNGAIALRGNHDQMFLDWLLTDDYMNAYNYFQNGGIMTVISYVGLNWNEDGRDLDDAKKHILKHYPDHIELLQQLRYYFEKDNHIFVHAGINPHLEDWKYTSNDEFIWIRDQFLNYKHEHKQTFVHGHTPTIYLHKRPDIYFGDKKIGIDGACAYGHQLNCLVIEGETYKTFSVERAGE